LFVMNFERHCERSEAIQGQPQETWIASLLASSQ